MLEGHEGPRERVSGCEEPESSMFSHTASGLENEKKQKKQPLMKRRDCSKTAEIRRTSAFNHIQPASKIIHTDRKRVNLNFAYVSYMATIWLID